MKIIACSILGCWLLGLPGLLGGTLLGCLLDDWHRAGGVR